MFSRDAGYFNKSVGRTFWVAPSHKEGGVCFIWGKGSAVQSQLLVMSFSKYLFFDTGSHYVALARLELVMESKLSLKSQN